MKKEIVQKILNETEIGYDLMADKFSETRKYFWRDLEFIKDYAKDGDNILDFGCGNGRLLELFFDKNIKYRGVDISEKLINLAGKRYYSENIAFSKINPSFPTKFTIAESKEESKAGKLSSNNVSNSYNMNLVGNEPFPDNNFNTVYSIAVFHHLPSKELRIEIVKDIYRVLKPGGYVIITVWNLWQQKYIKNIIKNWLNKLLLKSNLDWNDCYIAFKDNEGEIFSRYHHAFTKGELKKLFEKAGFKTDKIITGRNLIYIGKKS